MKKKILLLMGVFSLGLLQAQVGVNTKTPLAGSVLHIDPKGDTNGATGLADDILIDSKGYMGIGTLSPQTHLHIDKGTSASFIRIEDTSEGTGVEKYLVSDTDGRGSWIVKPQLFGKVYRMTSPTQAVMPFVPHADTPMLFNKVKPDTGDIADNPDNGYIRIDADGNYVFTFRWWGAVEASPPSNLDTHAYNTFRAFIKIRKVESGVVQSTDLDNVLVYSNVIAGGATANRFSFTVSLFVSGLKKNDIYTIVLNPDNDENVNWMLGYQLNGPLGQFDNIVYFPSVMVYNI